MKSKDTSKIYAKDLPCIHSGCPNKNSGKKQMCSTHYKQQLRESNPVYAEEIKKRNRENYRNNSEKFLAAQRRYKEKSVEIEKPETFYDPAECIKLTYSLDSLLENAGIRNGGSHGFNEHRTYTNWRTYLNNLIEDEQIKDWNYNATTNEVTVVITKESEMAIMLAEMTNLDENKT